jgi:alkyl hydroperoxide reductase subunit AhpC
LPCREHVAQLRKNIEILQSLDTQVVFVSFGNPRLARAWLEETQAPFPLLLDDAKDAYRKYEMEHSLRRSWGLKNFLLYVRLLLSGRKWRGIQGDSGQLGGDIIVDSHGVIRFVHRSHDPTDRPTLERIVECLEELRHEAHELSTDY